MKTSPATARAPTSEDAAGLFFGHLAVNLAQHPFGHARHQANKPIDTPWKGDAGPIGGQTVAHNSGGLFRAHNQRHRKFVDVGHRRTDKTGAYDREANAIAPMGMTQSLAPNPHGCFRGAIGRRTGYAKKRSDRRHNGNLPRAARHHARQGRLHRIDDAIDIDRIDFACLIIALATAEGTARYTGICDDQVERLRCIHLLNPLCDGMPVRDIEDLGGRRGTGGDAGRGHRFEARAVAPREMERNTGAAYSSAKAAPIPLEAPVIKMLRGDCMTYILSRATTGPYHIAIIDKINASAHRLGAQEMRMPTRPRVTISHLIDVVELRPVLIAWYEAEWAPWYCPGGAGDAAQDVAVYRSRDTLPLCLVALDPSGTPLGSAALKWESLGDELEVGPWLAALLVERKYRGQGIAARLIDAIKAEAMRLEFDAIYTSTEIPPDRMAANGWQASARPTVSGDRQRFSLRAHMTA